MSETRKNIVLVTGMSGAGKTSAMNIGVKSVNTISNVDYNVYDLNILVDDKQMLDRYISIIKQIPSVNDCVRGNK